MYKYLCEQKNYDKIFLSWTTPNKVSAVFFYQTLVHDITLTI